MARKLLKINDSAWLFAESRRTPMQVGMLATFRVPEDRADVRRRPGRALARRCTSSSRRTTTCSRSCPVPSWVEVARRPRSTSTTTCGTPRCPHRARQRELGVLVSRLHSAKMDRRYPLWEVHVIEGLERGRQWALYMKAHHSQVDGVGGIRLLRADALGRPRRARHAAAVGRSAPTVPTSPGVPRARPTAPRLEQPARPAAWPSWSAPACAAGAAVGAARWPGPTPRRSPAAPTTTAPRPSARPRRSSTAASTRPRRFATQHYPIERLKAIAKAADASLNDVFLADLRRRAAPLPRRARRAARPRR